MGWEGRSGGGRRELGRVALVSLTSAARVEFDLRRARNQRLRMRRAHRRVKELESALARLERGEAPLHVPWYAHRPVVALVGVVWVATLGALAVVVAEHGASGRVVGAVDVAMLVSTLLWFCVTVARRAVRDAG